VDLALFSAGGAISKEFAPIAVKAGCVVIDNSNAFRMDDGVPLVIPEINAGDLKHHHGIIANPNCTTAITLMALYPLHQAFGVTRIFASSYQAVSGTGPKPSRNSSGRSGSRRRPAGDARGVSPSNRLQRAAPCGRFSAQRLHQGRGEDGKRRAQDHASSRLSRQRDLRARPVYRAIPSRQRRISTAVTLAAARTALEKAPGLDVVDDPAKKEYPLPLAAAEQYNCQVGRLRLDCALDNGLCFWVAGDQLLKGAALNAVQIAEELMK